MNIKHSEQLSYPGIHPKPDMPFIKEDSPSSLALERTGRSLSDLIRDSGSGGSIPIRIIVTPGLGTN